MMSAHGSLRCSVGSRGSGTRRRCGRWCERRRGDRGSLRRRTGPEDDVLEARGRPVEKVVAALYQTATDPDSPSQTWRPACTRYGDPWRHRSPASTSSIRSAAVSRSRTGAPALPKSPRSSSVSALSPPSPEPKTAAELLTGIFPPLGLYYPHLPTVSAPQTAFLLLDCREAFYGGAWGGGRSDALLIMRWPTLPSGCGAAPPQLPGARGRRRSDREGA